ncbi:MAG: DUF5018 domain-containing protein [Treponema sp.]|nr:DUF5018 domain-containing protein [Treponema sp.]
MRKRFLLPAMLAAFVAACSNPLLKWIDTPSDTVINSGSGTASFVSDSAKTITTFSFGLGETAVIEAEPLMFMGEIGKEIPITVVVPAGTPTGSLVPAITIDGKSVSPASGTPADFGDPVTYTVTARDGSTRDYKVKVSVKVLLSPEIVRFDLSNAAGPNMVEGVVQQPPEGGVGEIILNVPSETNLANLTAKIVQTGQSVSGGGRSASGTAVSLTGNFSSPVLYTVTGEGGSNLYNVRVVREKSSVKAITALSFNGVDMKPPIISADRDADGKIPIIAMVPAGTDLKHLTPSLTYRGASVSGAGISHTRLSDADMEAAVPVPGSGLRDFSSVQPYTVRAEDGSEQVYEVTVLEFNTGKAITGFYFPFLNNPQGTGAPAGIIDEAAKTITVTVPPGTDLTTLAPAVYHTGESVGPVSGQQVDFSNSAQVPVYYTVWARDGTSARYAVRVYPAKRGDKAVTAFGFANVGGETTIIGSGPAPDGKIPISVTVPYYSKPGEVTDLSKLTPELTFTGVSVSGPGVSGTGPGAVTGSTNTNFTTPAEYTVTAEDGTTQKYSVTVVRAANPAPLALSDDASIDGFYFTSPPAAGTINQNAGTITVTVPYGTVLTNLVPAIYFTGNIVVEGSTADTTTPPTSSMIGGIEVFKPAMSSPAGIPADFTHSTTTDFTVPVRYTVTPLSRNPIYCETYTVTVNVAPAPPLSGVREISFFSFFGIDDVDITTAVSTVQDSSGNYPVEVIVPENTDLTDSNPDLKPVILYKGVSISGSAGETFDPPEDHPTDPEMKGIVGVSVVDFTSPRDYTVTAANGQSSRYKVTVRTDDNNVKQITGFYFTAPAAVGVIDEGAKTITVTVPSGTGLAALAPTVAYKGVSLSPASGAARNFSSPVVYTVTARNGTIQPYTVRVILKPAGTKDITSFTVPGAIETVIGAAPDPGGYTPISVTVSSLTSITALRPVITHTGVSITPQGGTAQTANPYTDSPRNFGVPQIYTVTAEDGSVKNYAVSVHVAGSGIKVITGFVFESVPLSGGETVKIVAQIDQDAHTIEAALPADANITGTLAPVISYLGQSAGYAGIVSGVLPSVWNDAPQGQSGAVYTDDPKTFTVFPDCYYYTVKAGDDTTAEYTLKLTKIPRITITYEPVQDEKFITERFDQSTGVLTIEIIPLKGNRTPAGAYNYNAPYQWRVDNVLQPVSSTQTSLSLRVTDFQPGQHEVVVMATRTEDGKHYTNKLFFSAAE